MATVLLQGGVRLNISIGSVMTGLTTVTNDTTGVQIGMMLGFDGMHVVNTDDRFGVSLGGFVAAIIYTGLQSQNQTDRVSTSIGVSGSLDASNGSQGGVSMPSDQFAKMQRVVSDALEKIKQVNVRKNEMSNTINRMLIDGNTQGATAAEDIAKLRNTMTLPAAILSDYKSLENMSSHTLDIIAAKSSLSKIEFKNLDPKIQLHLLKQQSGRMINQAVRQFRDELKKKPSWVVNKISLQFLDDMKRLNVTQSMLDEANNLATALKYVSPVEFANGPYKELVGLASNITFDGYIPSGLHERVTSVMREMMETERVVDLWRQKLTARL